MIMRADVARPLTRTLALAMSATLLVVGGRKVVAVASDGIAWYWGVIGFVEIAVAILLQIKQVRREVAGISIACLLGAAMVTGVLAWSSPAASCQCFGAQHTPTYLALMIQGLMIMALVPIRLSTSPLLRPPGHLASTSR